MTKKEKQKERSRMWYLRNKDKLEYKQKAKINTENHKEKKKEYDKKHFWEIKENHLKRNYGINLKEYNNLFKKYNGLCAICKNPEKRKSRISGNTMSLVVDHDHETGKIRGLLCNNCNIVLGKFKDNLILFNRAINYLEDKL